MYMPPINMDHKLSIWETSLARSSLVSIGTHSLFVSVSGPLRQTRLPQSKDPSCTASAGCNDITTSWTDDPIIIIFPGSGESSSSWPRVQEQTSRFARILLYDRTGLGKSDRTPLPIDNAIGSNNRSTNINDKGEATVAAEELCTLLDITRISGPYILVAHSYGAIVAREFLHLRQRRDVVGMVLADASTERQLQYFRVRDPNIMVMMKGLKFAEVTGLKSKARLSPEEWELRAMETKQAAEAIKAETAAYEDVCRKLGQKRQFEKQVLGSRPLSVIKCRASQDYEKLYEAGLKAGNGTQAQRKEFRFLLDRWDGYAEELQRDQLQLSSHARWVEVPDCGHNVNILRPDIIVKEIRWVLTPRRNSEVQL